LAVTGEAEGKETIVEDRRGPGTAAGSDATDDAEKSDGRVSCLNENPKMNPRGAMLQSLKTKPPRSFGLKGA